MLIKLPQIRVVIFELHFVQMIPDGITEVVKLYPISILSDLSFSSTKFITYLISLSHLTFSTLPSHSSLPSSITLSSSLYSLLPLFSHLLLSHTPLFLFIPTLPSPSLPSPSLHSPLRAAMEKMQTIYTDNPKLGDPNAVAQSLEVCQRRIDELGAELEKFKVSWS